MTRRNKTWRKVKVEVSPDEGLAGSSQEAFSPPSLEGFGIPTPERLIGLAMCYQTAQKIHAATDLHDPDNGYRNNRPRDLVDLVLIRQLSDATGHPSKDEIGQAVVDIFEARAKEAALAGRNVRAATSVGLELNAKTAANFINEWLIEIEKNLKHTTKIGGSCRRSIES